MRVVLLIFLIIILGSCASVRTVKPLAKNEKHIIVDLGGPLINFNHLPLFIPLSSIGATYGFSDNLSGHFSLHTTAALFSTVQNESSINLSILKKDNSGLSTNLGFYYFFGLRENKSSIYPFIDLNYYVSYCNKPNYFYTSITPLFELHKNKAFDEPVDKRIILNLASGHRWVKNKWEFGTELKYLNFTKNNQDIVVDYIFPNHYGSLGIYLQLVKKL